LKVNQLIIGNGVKEWFTLMYKSKQAGQLYMETTFKPDADSTAKPMAMPATQTIVQPIIMQQPMAQPMYAQPQPMYAQQPMM